MGIHWLLRLVLIFTLCSSSADCIAWAGVEEKGRARSAQGILIQAPAEVVWKAVHDERQQDPGMENSRVLSHQDNQLTIEQKFIDVPVFGSAVATTKHVETPYTEIDYRLASSNRFKKLEGKWTLKPMDDGKATYLELSFDMDLGVPFSGKFIRNAANKKLIGRLDRIKRLSEAEVKRQQK